MGTPPPLPPPVNNGRGPVLVFREVSQPPWYFRPLVITARVLLLGWLIWVSAVLWRLNAHTW